jgi:multiple sugar transport system permease protein
MLRQQRVRFAYYLILPSVILITLLNLVPMIEGIVVSLQNQNMLRPNPDGFVGFKHYNRALFDEELVWASLGRTVFWTIGSVAGGYLVGLSLALLLNMEIRGRTFFRALLLVPWVVPDVATALIWKWLYADEFGVINFLLSKSGIISQPVLWLADPNLALPSVILVQVWKLTPVMFIVLLAALQNVPKELYESAMIDGAGPFQRLWHVTLPLIRSTSVIITLLASIWTFQAFDLVYLLTGGGPADATKILPTLIYEKAFWASDLGYAAAIGMLMLVCLLILSVAYLFVYRAQGATVEAK